MTDYPFQSDDLSPEALGLPDRSDEVRVGAEAIEAFERVFYAEHPQDCVRPLSKALRAFLDAWESRVGRVTRSDNVVELKGHICDLEDALREIHAILGPLVGQPERCDLFSWSRAGTNAFNCCHAVLIRSGDERENFARDETDRSLFICPVHGPVPLDQVRYGPHSSMPIHGVRPPHSCGRDLITYDADGESRSA